MRLVDVHARLLELKIPAFRTSDAAALLKIGNGHASTLLARLADAGHILHLGRTRWVFKERAEPLALPEYLTSPFPSYISLQSALYFHGIISQIPEVTYAVSIARTKIYETALGTVSVHHIHPKFFWGFEPVGRGAAKMATPEKALIDFFYLSPGKSRLFRALPELEIPRGFSIQQARKIIARIASIRRRTLVRKAFEEQLGKKE